MKFDKSRDDNEAYARQKIDEQLRASGWRLVDTADNRRNVRLEHTTDNGREDYLLMDSKNFPLCVIEAKKPSINPLSAKDQARRYAVASNIRFVILSNGEISYLWDMKNGNPQIITTMPTQESLEQKAEFIREIKAITAEKIIPEYIALTKNPNLLAEPNYINSKTRNAYCRDNGYRILRDYQIDAIEAVQNSVIAGNDRFLIEMATGLGKTLIAGAIIQMFLRTGNACRVLFLVDRLELEKQAWQAFKSYLCDYTCIIYKQKRNDWQKADVVISTIQTMMSSDRYKTFSPTDFDFIISDEAHRSIGGNSRAVFEYFVGYKLGLTATPKDYIKNVDTDKMKTDDPKALERRILLDTYKTFGCQSGEPTFRYSLPDGVRNGYLINQKAIDARTDITTELLSEQGYAAIGITETGEEGEAQVVSKDFEKKFFNENVNSVFCETFMRNAQRDPISGEIGKTLVFCVSQNHAAKIAQILNGYAMQAFPNKYSSDFAAQVTSLVAGAQEMTTDFANNKLNGTTRFLEGYQSSRTRVCCTVGMMTTGYDCSDLLNIVFMRPIFSPTDFVQMKGRGTRKNTFQYTDAEKNEIKREKEVFKMFDFFANCEYFESKFNYDDKIKLPKISKGGDGPDDVADPKSTITSVAPDGLQKIEELPVPDNGMRIDREFWGNVQKEIADDDDIKTAVDAEDWDRAVALTKDRYENKPKLFANLERIQKANKLDRRLSWREVLEKIFGFIGNFKSRDLMLDDECEKFISIAKPEPTTIPTIRNFIKAYVLDADFRAIIEKQDFPRLYMYAGFDMDDYKTLGDLRNILPTYIKENIILNNYME
jgi:type I restriction enzyme R subunit